MISLEFKKMRKVAEVGGIFVNLFQSPEKDRLSNEIPITYIYKISQEAQWVKNPPPSAGNITDLGSIPGLGRYPGERHENPFQHSCLGNPMDRGACWATVHRVAKS